MLFHRGLDVLAWGTGQKWSFFCPQREKSFIIEVWDVEHPRIRLYYINIPNNIENNGALKENLQLGYSAGMLGSYCQSGSQTKLCPRQYTPSGLRERTNHAYSRMQCKSSLRSSQPQQERNRNAKSWSSYWKSYSAEALPFSRLSCRHVLWRTAPAKKLQSMRRLSPSEGLTGLEADASHPVELPT